MYALESKKIPNTQYFTSFSAAEQHAKILGLSKRSYKIRSVH